MTESSSMKGARGGKFSLSSWVHVTVGNLDLEYVIVEGDSPVSDKRTRHWWI